MFLHSAYASTPAHSPETEICSYEPFKIIYHNITLFVFSYLFGMLSLLYHSLPTLSIGKMEFFEKIYITQTNGFTKPFHDNKKQFSGIFTKNT